MKMVNNTIKKHLKIVNLKFKFKKMKIQKNILYWVGKPEVQITGRFGRRITTYKTAILNDDGIIYREQSYLSRGKLGIPKNVIHIKSKTEFLKLIK